MALEVRTILIQESRELEYDGVLVDTGLLRVEKQKWRCRLAALKEIGMVADLAELHDEVHQPTHDLLAHRGLVHQVGDRDLVANAGVEALLTLGQVARQIDLDLLGKLVFDILLDATHHERLENHVEAVDLLCAWMATHACQHESDQLATMTTMVVVIGENERTLADTAKLLIAGDSALDTA